MGVGAGLASALDARVEGLRPFPALVRHGIALPATPADLWLWLRADDRGDLIHLARALEGELEDAFALESMTDVFSHDEGRDLSGYEIGVANPLGSEAADAVTVADAGSGLSGGSFVAVQQWSHDLDAFESGEDDERDAMIGRRYEDGDLVDDAPASAHVRRVRSEATGPGHDLVRRSMAWGDADGEGLMVMAFARSLDPFERALERMMGFDDGIVDATFGWSRPTTGAYYWCPPVERGMLDLQALGL